MRSKINLTDSTTSVTRKMAEGNPGATTVLGLLLRDGMGGFRTVLDLDDMNIRGPQIWVAYRYYCKQDLATLKKAAFDRNAEMVAKVNEGQYGIDFTERAVCSGASYRHCKRISQNGKALEEIHKDDPVGYEPDSELDKEDNNE